MIDTLSAILESGRGLNAFFLALASFFIYAVVSNLAALPAISERLGVLEASRSLVPRTTLGIVIELLRFGFYVGIPFVALFLGWVDVRVMGFGVLDWAEGVRWAIVVLLASWLILMVIWLPYLRATADVYASPNSARSFPRRMVELVYMQSHWAFYRGAAILLLTGILPDAGYWGTAIGLGLVYLEAMTNPRTRRRLSRLGEADPVVWSAGQAVINALGFLVTLNFFLLVLIQFILEMTVPHLRPTRAERSPLASPSVARPQRVRE